VTITHPSTATTEGTTTMHRTLADVIGLTDTDVLDHLDREVTIPVLPGLQPQGDIMVIPIHAAVWDAIPVPASGVPVVRGENGGNTHLLVADGPVTWAPNPRTGAQTLGEVTVPDGSVAYLLHPEHGAAGIAPGTYVIRRQREQRDAIELVAD